MCVRIGVSEYIRSTRCWYSNMVMLNYIMVIDEITDILRDLKKHGNLKSVNDEFERFVYNRVIDISNGMSTITDEKAFIYEQVLLLVTEENVRAREMVRIRKLVDDEQRAEDLAQELACVKDHAQKLARAEEDRTRALAELSPQAYMDARRKQAEDEICDKPSWYGISSTFNGKKVVDTPSEPVAGGSRFNGKEPADAPAESLGGASKKPAAPLGGASKKRSTPKDDSDFFDQLLGFRGAVQQTGTSGGRAVYRLSGAALDEAARPFTSDDTCKGEGQSNKRKKRK